MSIGIPSQSTISEPALPAVSRGRAADRTWILAMTGMSLGLGVLLALAVRTTQHVRDSDSPNARLGVSAAFLERYRDQGKRLEQEILDLRHRQAASIADVKDDDRATTALKQSFDDLKTIGGLAAMQGPGLRITLRDSTQSITGDPPGEYIQSIVHDQDLNSLIAELKAGGARAIAISGADITNMQRVIVTTTARCAGPIAVVNGAPLSAPYTILALGDPKVLRATLERPDGYLRFRRFDQRKMISIDEVEKLAVPEYSGTLSPRYAHAVTSN